MFVCPNNVQETSLTTGTGPLTLEGAVAGARDFDSQLATGDTCPYTIRIGDSPTVEESGIGTFTAPNQLARTTVLESTAGGALVDFGAGTKNVSASLPGGMVQGLIDPDGTTGVVVRTAAATYERQAAQAIVQAATGYIVVTDPAYGATGDGSTDDSGAIQAAIDAAELVPGTRVLCPPGAYNLGTTGLNILEDAIILDGAAPRFVGAALFGVEFLYSGTGVAVTFGSTGKNAHYRCGFNNIQIRATGAAVSSGTAIGLQLINQHYFSSANAAIKDFEQGVGLQFRPLNAGSGFGALNRFDNLLTHLCDIGIQALSVDAFTKENAATFIGGSTIGTAAVGSIGVHLDGLSDAFTFYSMDFESSDYNVKNEGAGHRFIATRTEFQLSWGIWCTSTSVRTGIIGHQWSGSATESDTLLDEGTANYRLDERGFFNPPKLQPMTDRSEALYMTKADGSTVIFDVITNGTYPEIFLPNSTNVVGYSDAFVTETYRMTGLTGMIEAYQFKAHGARSELIDCGLADGTTIFDISGLGADGTVNIVNSCPMIGWSDNFTTITWKLTSETGNIEGTSITLTGVAESVGAGEVGLGGSTAILVGAAGGAAPLPETPLGYLVANVAGTTVKIPYYNN